MKRIIVVALVALAVLAVPAIAAAEWWEYCWMQWIAGHWVYIGHWVYVPGHWHTFCSS